MIAAQVSAIAAPPVHTAKRWGLLSPKETKILKMPPLFHKLYKSYKNEENNLKKK